LIHKTKQDGYQKQLVALAAHSGWESSEQLSQALQRTGVGASHDRLDAFMSAWVSYLFCIGKAKALGLLPDDAIWIPDVEKGLPAEKFQVANHSVRNKKTKSSPIGKFSRNSECLCCRKGMDSELPRKCPECGHVFKGIGWGGIDAHWRANHESTGVSYEQFRQSLCAKHR